MNKQSLVSDFHRAFSQPAALEPGIGEGFPTDLRIRLIEEEAKETCDALRAGDLVEAIDGLCDLLYVTYGTAVAMGIDIDPFFFAVHRSNMAKVNPATGKPDFHPEIPGRVIKPEGWQPPDIAGMLTELLNEDGKTGRWITASDKVWHYCQDPTDVDLHGRPKAICDQTLPVPGLRLETKSRRLKVGGAGTCTTCRQWWRNQL